MKIDSRKSIHSIAGRFVAAPILSGIVLIGCGGTVPEQNSLTVPSPKTEVLAPVSTKEEVDPDDVPIKAADVEKPKGYADAVSRVEAYRDKIRDEIAAGRPTKAHRGLDELDIVLNWLPGIARDSGVPKEHWEKLNTTAKSIQDLFNQVHSRIDDKKEPDYGSVSEAIDKAISELKTIAEPKTVGNTETKP